MKNKYTEIILNRIERAGLPRPELEHRFHPLRRWRFDFAWLKQKVAVEFEGGVYTGGRHARGAGIVKDCEKYNTAQIMGWIVLRYTAGTLDDMVRDLREVFRDE